MQHAFLAALVFFDSHVVCICLWANVHHTFELLIERPIEGLPLVFFGFRHLYEDKCFVISCCFKVAIEPYVPTMV